MELAIPTLNQISPSKFNGGVVDYRVFSQLQDHEDCVWWRDIHGTWVKRQNRFKLGEFLRSSMKARKEFLESVLSWVQRRRSEKGDPRRYVWISVPSVDKGLYTVVFPTESILKHAYRQTEVIQVMDA